MRIFLYIICMCAALSAWGETADPLFEQAKQTKDPAQQVELLSQVIEKSPQHVDAYHYRADAYVALEDYVHAVQDYNRVVSLRPKDSFRYYARGLANHKMGENTLAVADFSKAISLNASYENFYLARARSYRALEKYPAALADYKKYVGETWKGASKPLLREMIPVAIGAYRYDEAQAMLSALKEQGDDSSQLYHWQGQLLQNEGELDEAVSAFSKAVNRAPKNPAWLRSRASAFKEMGDYEAALEDYSLALTLDPKAYWFNRRGLVYEELRDYEHARNDYHQAVVLEPKWAIAYNNRGFARLNLKDFPGAKADFEMAILLDPTAPTPYVNLAGWYWTNKKDRKNMYKYLEKALQHNFENFEALFDDKQKGWLFKEINQTAEFKSALYK